MYAIIDIETTGGQIQRDRITEIAIILYDGEQVIDEFQSLINPERSIPYNITKLTGISNQMVADAPKFFEVAKRVVEITTGAIFVAHNVGFDYKFIKEEFSRLGYIFTRKQLCTVRLSRQAFPGRRSYSLENMIQFLNISVEARHRAMADTKAAFFILKTVLAQQAQKELETMINRGVQASRLPPNITLEQLHAFPEGCGVYYFRAVNGEVIYVGKSINIKKRLLDHFANKTPKAMKMIQTVHTITHQLTGSELVALLFESNEIKRLKPIHNQAQKRTKFPYGIYFYKNENGFICFDTKKEKPSFKLITRYEKSRLIESTLRTMAYKYQLCRPFCGLEGLQNGKSCLNFQLGLCGGACAGNETVAAYNTRAQQAIEKLRLDFDDDFLIIEEGRTKEEEAVILVENGVYQGFGYIKINVANTPADYKNCVKIFENNPDTSRIVKQYLTANNTHRVVRF